MKIYIAEEHYYTWNAILNEHYTHSKIDSVFLDKQVAERYIEDLESKGDYHLSLVEYEVRDMPV